MSKHSDWIVELKDSGIDEAELMQKADQVSDKERYRLIHQSQYKLESQGLYVAKYDSYDKEDDTFDAEEPYDTYLEKAIKDYLADYDHIKQEAQDHFHQDMTMAYLIDYFIAKLHRRFENRQDLDSLVLVNGYEKEVK